LNKCHSGTFTTILRGGQQGRLEGMVESHGNYLQIINCIQLILIVEINQNAPNTNLQMSSNFSSTIKNSIGQINTNQANHGYEIKCKLLSKIIAKISNYKRIHDFFLL
jgi:hypothetical protein